MRNWLKTLLFLSAFSPALLTLAYVRYELHGWQTDVMQLCIIGGLGCIIPLLVVQLIVKSSESIAFTAKKIESNDFMLLAFVGSYLAPIVLKASDMSISAITIVTIVIGVILWLSSSIPSHPLLRLIRFKFYKVEAENGVVFTLISTRDIRDPKQLKSVKRLSSSMIMEIF